MASPAETHASSTGQGWTGGAWLDAHFEAARPEYKAQLRAVGIRPGWRVLDAACGSGAFLPWLADLVGSDGRLAALDLAPDNVALVERRATEWTLPCPVEARTGTVLALPYPGANFDAVWFANTTQYLTNEELEAALVELRRVVRPGGRVVVAAWGPPGRCETLAATLAALGPLMPPPPPGAPPGGPGALAAPGALAGVLTAAGLRVAEEGEVACPFTYPDAEAAWRGGASAGVVQRAIAHSGEAPVRAALAAADRGHVRPDGSVRYANTFLWAAGERP